MPRLLLPTANDALFRGDGEAFYQYVRRDFKGEISFPWEGGQYGFVRDPIETPGGIVYVHFHEGIDIKCLARAMVDLRFISLLMRIPHDDAKQ